MKKLGIGIVMLCVIALTSVISHAGVEGTLHDMSLYAWPADPLHPNPFANFDTGQVCVFCHTPHNANLNIQSGTYWTSGGYANAAGGTKGFLLWNRALSNATSMQLYTSSSMANTPTQVNVYSLLCLSCHDGVSAINVLNQQPGDMVDSDLDGKVDVTLGEPVMIGEVSGIGANIGDRDPSADSGVNNLSNDHPISMNYNYAQSVDAGLRAATGTYVGDPAVRLFPDPATGTKNSVECSTCHDVHNQGTDAAGTFPFLVVSNNGSGLCLQCHLK